MVKAAQCCNLYYCFICYIYSYNLLSLDKKCHNMSTLNKRELCGQAMVTCKSVKWNRTGQALLPHSFSLTLDPESLQTPLNPSDHSISNTFGHCSFSSYTLLFPSGNNPCFQVQKYLPGPLSRCVLIGELHSNVRGEVIKPLDFSVLESLLQVGCIYNLNFLRRYPFTPQILQNEKPLGVTI